LEELINLEKKLNEHIIFVYNNFNTSYNSMIDNELIKEIYLSFKKLQEYKKINIVLNSTGGNLASGTRLIDILKNMYESYEFTVLDRCHSTGTFIALSGDKLNLSPSALITSCEPQMDAKDISISTALIRNILEHPNEINKISELLDPIILGKYYSTINYFKDLCYRIYSKDKAELIIDFMLNQINSHQYPLSKEELIKMGINVNLLTGDLLDVYEKLENRFKLLFATEEVNAEKEYKLSFISDRNQDKVYVKRYKYEENSKQRIYEGYKVIDRR